MMSEKNSTEEKKENSNKLEKIKGKITFHPFKCLLTKSENYKKGI